MKTTKMLKILVLALGPVVWQAKVSEAAPMGTAWTYQGRLIDANDAADGLYDFQFKLFDDANTVTGNKLGTTIEVNDLDVIAGYFTVELDFGSDVFDGDARWLEIGVRAGDSNNSFVSLSPRQEITPVPYALQTRGMFVDNSGNVGIGTTSPGAKLEVLQSTWPDIMKIGADFATNWLIFSSGSQWASISGSTTNRDDIVIMHSTGNIGIGTTNPTSELHVEGTIEVDDTIKANDSGGLRFATDEGTTRLFIKDTGDIGIGTMTPTGKFDVQNSSSLVSANIRNSKSSGIAYGVNVLATGEGGTTHYAGRFSASGATSNYAIYADGIDSKSYFSGNVGIGTMSPSSKLHVVDGCITGSMCSDIRLKKNIEPLPSDDSILDRVMGLKAVTFEWKDRVDGKRQIGLIAQDVEEVFPEVVTTPDDGSCEKGLLATGMDAVLVEAIKELKVENELLKEQLKTQNQSLNKRLDALERIIQKSQLPDVM